MKIIDRIALNRFIKIITDFILSLIKLCGYKEKTQEPKPKRPIIDLLKKWF